MKQKIDWIWVGALAMFASMMLLPMASATEKVIPIIIKTPPVVVTPTTVVPPPVSPPPAAPPTTTPPPAQSGGSGGSGVSGGSGPGLAGTIAMSFVSLSWWYVICAAEHERNAQGFWVRYLCLKRTGYRPPPTPEHMLPTFANP